jgi:hypothetical protein
LLGERCALVEHGVDALADGAHAPAFDARHFGVEFPLVGLSQWQQLTKMRPAQLSPQRGHNCLVRKRLGELHHAAEVFVGEAAAKLGDQLSRHRVGDAVDLSHSSTKQLACY